jgi:hypothetical protein
LLELRDDHLRICPCLANETCAFLKRDTFENYCSYPHHPFEIFQWEILHKELQNAKPSLSQQLELDKIQIEELLIVWKNKKLKKILGSYAKETHRNETIDDLISKSYKIEECNYTTLWHRFINSEMNSCIAFVEKYKRFYL